jgi:hypothetical protein
VLPVSRDLHGSLITSPLQVRSLAGYDGSIAAAHSAAMSGRCVERDAKAEHAARMTRDASVAQVHAEEVRVGRYVKDARWLGTAELLRAAEYGLLPSLVRSSAVPVRREISSAVRPSSRSARTSATSL